MGVTTAGLVLVRRNDSRLNRWKPCKSWWVLSTLVALRP